MSRCARRSIRGRGRFSQRHCERSEAIHLATQRKNGLLRRFAARNDGQRTSQARERKNVRHLSVIIEIRLPPILSRRSGRSRLRLRDRQGVAVNDGRDFSDYRAALCKRRPRRLDARYGRADLLARAAQRARQARDDRARVLWSGWIYPCAPPCRFGHRLYHQGRNPLATGRRRRRDVQGRPVVLRAARTQCTWSRPMPATPSLRS